MKIINSSLFILGLLYPFIIYFFSKYLWIFFLLFSLLWLVKFIFTCSGQNSAVKESKNEFVKIFQSYSLFFGSKYMSFAFFLLFFFMFIIKYMNIQFEEVIYIYPVIIYIIFFAVFMYEVKEKPLIQSFAELEHKIRNLAPLTNKEKRYTYILTYIWSYFFLASALLCIFLSLLENKKYWVFYTGAAGYMLTGLLFISERLLRHKIIKIMK